MLSIIIPTLNEESVIRETLENITQCQLPHEVIVSDGGSRDKTADISREILGTDKVLVYSGEKRQTIAGGRNAGAAIAKGDMLVFIDADITIPDPTTFFTKALTYFEKDERLVAITVRVKVLPEFATFLDRLIFGTLFYVFAFQNNITGNGAAAGEFQMIRKSAFEKVRGYNELLVAAEDMDMLSRLTKLGRVRSVGDLTVYHTGRRAHKIGWPKLLSQWAGNTYSMWFHGRAKSEVWEEVR